MTDTLSTPSSRAFEAYVQGIENRVGSTEQQKLYRAWTQALADEQAEAKRQRRLAQEEAGRHALIAELGCLAWDGAENDCEHEVGDPSDCRCYRAAQAVLAVARGE